jgi:4-carboxymuconolactone decarboxylase
MTTDNQNTDYKKTERYQKGLASFKKHLGEGCEKYVDRLEAIYPKFSRVNVEFPFGDLYGDETVLDQRTRELVTIGALTVLGHALPQLKIHVKAALRCGAKKNEILEVITQMLAYGGFPSATNALIAADEAFKEVELK